MKNLWLYSALLMIPLYGFWIMPQHKALKAEHTTLASLETETAEYRDRIKKLKDLDTLLSDPKYDGVLERVPSTLEQETLIVILQKITESTGFVFEGIKFNRGQNPELQTSTLQANFNVRGREDKFLDFLRAVEKSPRFMGLETFAYNVETINGINVVDMGVPLYTFAQSSEN